MLGARLKRAANVIGVDLAQSELTSAASVADRDNHCFPARDAVATCGELAGFATEDLTCIQRFVAV